TVICRRCSATNAVGSSSTNSVMSANSRSSPAKDPASSGCSSGSGAVVSMGTLYRTPVRPSTAFQDIPVSFSGHQVVSPADSTPPLSPAPHAPPEPQAPPGGSSRDGNRSLGDVEHPLQRDTSPFRRVVVDGDLVEDAP